MHSKNIFFAIGTLALLTAAGGWFVYKAASRPTPPPVDLSKPGANERVITIIPGWDLWDIAEYFASGGIVSTSSFFQLTGMPAELFQDADAHAMTTTLSLEQEKPGSVSWEGYLAPETYRVYKSATLEDILEKLLSQREKEFTPELRGAIQAQGKTVHQILTMASIIEKEVKRDEDRAKVADILWRRLKLRWALQVDSSVHYALGKEGTVFTTAKDRRIDSPWNTYKYPGLPPGPICNPGIESIKAAIYPEKNDYWYFLTTPDGEVKYAKTLEEHNANRAKYLQN